MSMRKSIGLALKVIALTVIMFVSFTIASGLAGLGTGPGQTASAQAGAALALLAVCFLDTLVLAYLVVRSRWSGWRLVLAVFLVHYGVMTFLSQIETAVFLGQLVRIIPAEMLPRLFLQGAIVAALFAPLAVLILGKIKTTVEQTAPNTRLVMPWAEWLWKLAAIAVIYVVVYLSFGLFVFRPLAGSAFGRYYAGLRMPGWMIPFQLARGLIWTALALPVIRMMKGRWWEAGLAVALLFSILMGLPLILPNPYMPPDIRLAHLAELLSSNFVFGWIVVWLFHRRHSQ